MTGLRGRRTAVACSGVLLALLASSLTAPAQADPVGAKDSVECPDVVPPSDVQAGMIGQGHTVVRGANPQPFDVEVLGVLTDGIGAGRDLIIINATDVTGGHVIDQGGGIWAGMSGSPVYVDGKLLGAVSAGFSEAPSSLGGVTPASDMVELLDLPGAPAVRAKGLPAKNKAVKLSAAARRDLAAKAGVATPRGTLRPLVTPLAVSGLSAKRIDRLQSTLDAAGWSVRAYAASRAAAPNAQGVAVPRPRAGGNFAAVLSYGDASAAYTGTTTLVCKGQALAFGHDLDMLVRSGTEPTTANQWPSSRTTHSARSR